MSSTRVAVLTDAFPPEFADIDLSPTTKYYYRVYVVNAWTLDKLVP